MIVLGHQCAYLWQPRAGNSWEIVVFVVIADVEGDPIQRSVVRVCFVAFGEHVVLGDKVASNRVNAHGK